MILNSRRYTVTADLAPLAMEIDGKEIEVAKVFSGLKGKGVTGEPIEKNVID